MCDRRPSPPGSVFVYDQPCQSRTLDEGPHEIGQGHEDGFRMGSSGSGSRLEHVLAGHEDLATLLFCLVKEGEARGKELRSTSADQLPAPCNEVKLDYNQK